jgi:methylglutaconyl-CoA hydratase
MTTGYQTIELDVDDSGIAALTLARPEKHNALNALMIAELTEAAGRIATDEAIRAVVLGSRGLTFCAGGDLQWMHDQAARDRPGKMEGALELSRMLQALDELPKPLIGRVQGNAFGGGVGMISVCDIVVAANLCQFALTETRLGLIPATIGPYVVRRIGEGAARRLLLSGERFSAETAREIGLLSVVCPPEDLDRRIAGQAAAFLECAPGAVAATKRLVRQLARQEFTDPVGQTAGLLADRWESAEGRTGIEAFLARRPMPWTKG